MKRGVAELAYFGGTSAFLQKVFVGRPNVGDRCRFLDRLDWVLNNRWLTNDGPLVREFEGRIAEFVGVRNCVVTCNATIALQLLARACDLTGEVIMPSLTFPATPQSMRWLGLDVVFCDVDPVTGCLDPARVEAALSPRTAAIMGVHLWGRPCAVAELQKIAAANDVVLLYDAAQALGVTAEGRPIGGFGAAEVFSFHATKVVNSFEGGAIVTDDDGLAARLRPMRNFGLTRSGSATAVGTNAKMTEVAAAMGLTSLDAYPDSVAHNEANYDQYRGELTGLAGVEVLRYDRHERNNFHYLIIQVDGETTGLCRDALLDVLRAENIMAQRYFSPGCHRMPPFAGRASGDLAHTERIADRVLALPTGAGVTREDIRRICDVVRVAASHGGEVTARWHARNEDLVAPREVVRS